MGIYGILGIVIGLLLLLAPGFIYSLPFLPKIGKGSVGVDFKRRQGPTWLIRLGGLATIVIGILEIFGVITVG
ncbi:hypothetical protein CMI47_16700 [Candidatus Pacearchaeota archaeon]|nr:hypothetical protein [Candidatus Pacearchaeota archaeon]|tara:strand:+ start:9707 stop:9925 length:219 start_codon:yes stop_codon:yes gene_type:complete